MPLFVYFNSLKCRQVLRKSEVNQSTQTSCLSEILSQTTIPSAGDVHVAFDKK